MMKQDDAIRPARLEDAEAIGWVSVTAWRETYAGIMPDEYLASLSTPQRADLFRERIRNLPNGQAIFVATHQDDVVGFGVCGPTREADLGVDGEVFAINIVAAAQRRRLGVRLMAAMAEALVHCGFATVGLWVVEQNDPARRFYEALGGRCSTRKNQEFGSKKLVELGYIWPSVEDLRMRAEALVQAPG
ncbi:MAG: GNAT family N-acetyltransferase [Alphaproteobacteria bacterium]|nr:GNAT family N-acetyltransferase [Alphaproteobacteria bacterium]